VAHLASKGFQVLAMQRSAPKQLAMGVDFQRYDLSSPVNDSKFDGARYLIHTAYQPYSRINRDSKKVNQSGTRNLIAACKKRDIKIIFLSTMSAHEEAESNYGKSKLDIEKMFSDDQDLILKLGLVLGNGGLFNSIVNTITESRVLPLVAGDKLIQTVALTDLFALIEIGMSKQITGSYAIGESDPVSLKVLYKTIADAASCSRLFVPIPIGFIQLVCSIAETFGITLPIATENILGLKKMRTFKTEDNLEVFGYQLPRYDKSIQNLLISGNEG